MTPFLAGRFQWDGVRSITSGCLLGGSVGVQRISSSSLPRVDLLSLGGLSWVVVSGELVVGGGVGIKKVLSAVLGWSKMDWIARSSSASRGSGNLAPKAFTKSCHVATSLQYCPQAHSKASPFESDGCALSLRKLATSAPPSG